MTRPRFGPAQRRMAALLGGGLLLGALAAIVAALATGVIAASDVTSAGTAVRRAAASVGIGAAPIEPAVAVSDDEGDTVRVELTRGTATMAQVARLAEEAGRGEVLRRSDDAWVVAADLHVLSDARLLIDRTTVRLVGRGIETRGGDIEINDATVVGWVGDAQTGAVDTDTSDGRGWLAARGGGRLRIAGSRLRHLGHPAVGRTGVEWLGVKTSGALVDSTIERHRVGVALRGARDVTIATSAIVASERDGVLQEGGGPHTFDRLRIDRSGRDGMRLTDLRGGALTSLTVVASGRDGIVLRRESAGVTIDGSEVRDSAATGVAIKGTDGVVLRDSYVYGNAVGVLVENRARRTRVVDTRIAANDAEGLFVRDQAGETVVRDNLVDRNGAAGLALVNADVAVTGNRFEHNDDGMRIGEGDATGRVSDNEIVDNIEDGVDLPARPTPALRDNRIADNRRGAFSVLQPGRSDAVARRNTVTDNGDGQERVRDP